ncbi:hypothetical protein BDZ89DRAFT_1057737 [Hymenopellis radicata]|nr:hypothetical protein BDZ89DRAFT_1057737 [Hymenopellis radicata]
MSPRVPSSSSSSPASRSTSAPYQRRPSGQPKSSRQQFSACGACRMRRVRCDLKDLPIGSAGPHPACSNCRERGLKCVDEFADVKAVKLLRRGRRLQQVEAIYGKATDGLNSPNLASPATHLPSIIPQLKPDFFSSPFWRWFSLQRPILDSTEFAARFIAHSKGTHPLGHEGSVLSLLLVVWAASFGVDEHGAPMDHDDHGFEGSHQMAHAEFAGRNTRSASSTMSRPPKSSKARAGRKDNTDAMLRELLELVDYHSMMRKPTWDGIRVLLLLVPLLEDSSPLDRVTMQEATLLQARCLCMLSPSSNPSPADSDEALIRARIFWYAHLQEGITAGLRGGRLILTEDDLEAFQGTLPPYNFNITSIPSSDSPYLTTAHPYLQVTHLFSIPLHLSAVCRKTHTILTSAKALRKAEEGGGVDGEGIRELWDGLQRCWEEFESVKKPGGIDSEVDGQIERFASAWQVNNVIRDSLKKLVSRSRPGTNSSSPQPMFSGHSSPHPSPHGQTPPPYYTLQQLHSIATRKCTRLIPTVLGIIRHHLSCDISDMGGMFKWDAGLVRDGLWHNQSQFTPLKQEGDARMDGSLPLIHSSYIPVYDPEEGVRVCLAALGEMRWAFSKSEERRERISLVWEDNKMRHRTAQAYSQPHTPISDQQHIQEIEMRYTDSSAQPSHVSSFVDVYGPTGKMGSASTHHLPPLNVSNLNSSHSAPPTAYSTDSSTGAHGWPSYTPPGTSTSGSTAGTSMRSPVFSSLVSVPTAGIKSEGMLYGQHPAEIEPFNFSPPGTGPAVVGGDVSVMVGYHHSSHSARTVSNGFMDFSTTGPSSLTQSDGIDFVEDGGGYYH